MLILGNANAEGYEDDAIELPEIVVTDDADDLMEVKPESTLYGEELMEELAPTLGETLQNQPGVHNSTFGPGAGIPVIRGMTGSRIQVLQGSMGTFDASSISPDHAITIEPLLIEEIQIRRGPETLRYGSAAMGGAVDVKTGRIPESVPENNIEGLAQVRYDFNSNLKANVFKMDAGRGPYVLHVDRYKRTSDDIDIPGTALNEKAVREEFGSTIEFEDTKGFVANSDTESSGYSFGNSLVFDKGYIGASYNELDNNYGIPPGGLPPHSDDPANVLPTPENLRIDMHQTRWDAAAEAYDLPYGLDSVSLKYGNVDYYHEELARGLPATNYRSTADEIRFETEFTHSNNLDGSYGVQWATQEFGATGTESFIPPSNIDVWSAYLIESLWIGNKLNFEAGFRYENSEIKPNDSIRTISVSAAPIDLPDYDYRSRSYSGAFTYYMNEKFNLRLAYTNAGRNPAIQELLSIGPHFATRSYVIGNTELDIEKSSNIDLGLAFQNQIFTFNVNVFRNNIDNYIYQENQGIFYDIESQFFQAFCVELTDCLPVYAYQQQDAKFTGYEAELRFSQITINGLTTEFGLFSDYVRGEFVDASGDAADVPRLPPRRLGAFFDSAWKSFDFFGRFTVASKQKRAGLNETETDGYERLDLGVSFHKPFGFTKDTNLFVVANNITDEEIRHSTSFLRNFTPEPGRSIELGLRSDF